MRVVAGSLRSRNLKAPKGNHTRPTTDKVKGAIFNMLGQFFTGGIALDLYAGSGGLGIEALSRGIEQCYFVDNNYQALQVVKDNLSTLKIEEQAQVFKKDASQALQMFVESQQRFDLILLDPPYAKQKIAEQLAFIAEHQLLTATGTIVCEIDKDIQINIVEELEVVKEQNYGITKILVIKYKD